MTCESHRQAMRRFRQRHPERVKAVLDSWKVRNPYYHQQSTYGLQPGEYEYRLAQQEGKCAICKQVPEEILRVDHDHVTDQVRGLLCHRCNAGLGMLGDDPKRVLAAYNYLQDCEEILG